MNELIEKKRLNRAFGDPAPGLQSIVKFSGTLTKHLMVLQNSWLSRPPDLS
jgi:hypothetical protein